MVGLAHPCASFAQGRTTLGRFVHARHAASQAVALAGATDPHRRHWAVCVAHPEGLGSAEARQVRGHQLGRDTLLYLVADVHSSADLKELREHATGRNS